MARRTTQKSGFKVFVLFLIIALGFIFLPARIRRDNPVTRGFLTSLSMAQNLINNGFYGAGAIWSNYIYMINLNQTNKNLRDQLNWRKQDELRVAELSMENIRLRQLLGFKETNKIKAIPAQVVARDPSNWFKTIVINKGKDDGVPPNAAVVTHEGIVGRVIELSAKASKVLLISDYASKAAVLVQRSRYGGILSGKGGKICDILYMAHVDDVQVGDIIVTSGLGGIFPKGLKVGQVITVDKEDMELFQTIEVKPSADLTRLEEVLVIEEIPIETEEENQQAQQDQEPAGEPLVQETQSAGVGN